MDSFNQIASGKGYLLLKSKLPQGLLKTALLGSNRIVEMAKKGKISNIRVYRDFPYIFGGVNVWGVENPIHKSLANPDFNKLFEEFNIEALVIKVTGWKQTACKQFRIHTAPKMWNYQGTWHRDMPFETDDVINVNLYLDDEHGFRIVPENMHSALLKNSISEKELGQSDNLLLDPEFYDELSADAGDVLFFKSWLLHQGRYSSSRRHIHMCFVNLASVPEEKIVRALGMNLISKFNPFSDNIEINQHYKKSYKLRDGLNRYIRFINYIFPIIRVFRERRVIKSINSKFIKYSFSSNTIWQTINFIKIRGLITRLH